jgi:hypothetical protein
MYSVPEVGHSFAVASNDGIVAHGGTMTACAAILGKTESDPRAFTNSGIFSQKVKLYSTIHVSP